MPSERHREAARRLLADACGVHLDTITAAMVEPWAAALAAAEMRGAEVVREEAREIAARAEASVVAMEEIDALDLRALLEVGRG